MKRNGEGENLDQYRRPNSKRPDEIHHRQTRLSQVAKRRNGESLARMYGKTQVVSSGIVPSELSLAIALCILSQILSWPWSVVAAIVSILIFIMAVYDRHKKWKEKRRLENVLKDPFETHFLIPKATEHTINYYSQDHTYHYLSELTLPSDSEVDILIWMNPRLDLVVAELQFGCIGDNESKPEPLYYFNPWVKKGVGREGRPGVDEGHYIDSANYYHIVCRRREWPKDESLISGLRIKTKGKGTWRFWICAVMPEGRAEKILLMHVK